MNVLVVEDEQLALEDLKQMLSNNKQITTIQGASSGREALHHLQTQSFTIAFLDIELQDMSGLDLARQIKVAQPACSIVFVSAYAQYAVDAFKLHPMNYLLKPVSQADIEEEIDYFTKQHHDEKPKNALYVQCFGNFDVFIHGIPAKFRYTKTKELFAILIDRKGQRCTMQELADLLWEDKPDTLNMRSQLRNLFVDLTNILKSIDLTTALIKKRNVAMVDVEKLDCDYYQFLNKDASGINAYMGEYMAQYSWAEMTNGSLSPKE